MLLLLLHQMVLLRDLHLGVLLLLLLLLEGHLLAVDGDRFANDHATGGHDAPAPLGESPTQVFLLAELLFFLELAELGGRHGLTVSELDDAGGVVKDGRLLEGRGLLLLRLGLLLLLLLLGRLWKWLRLLLNDLLGLLHFL